MRCLADVPDASFVSLREARQWDGCLRTRQLVVPEPARSSVVRVCVVYPSHKTSHPAIGTGQGSISNCHKLTTDGICLWKSMATGRFFSSSGGGDATELLGAQIATSAVTSFPVPTNARPEARHFHIQLYAKGRSDTAQNHNRFADFVTESLGHLGPSWAIETAEPPPASQRAHQGIFLTLQEFYHPRQGGSNQTNAAMRSRPAPADTTRSRGVWKDLENLAEAFINATSTPPSLRGQLRTISQTRCDLLESLTTLDAAFHEAKGWVQAWSGRGERRDTGQELTTEEILEFAQLIGSFSRSADDTAAALNVLAPLLDERYILPKAANTGMAVIGTVVAVAVTFFWWNPMGWTASALGTAASFVAAHGTASAVTCGAGGVTAVVCGVKGKIGHDQCKLMDKVRCAKVRYQNQKNEVLRTLVLILAREQFQYLGHEDQKNICDRMGIQISLLGERGYEHGVLKTVWEDLEDAYNMYYSSLRAAAVVIE
ncbi:predicted protein [Chaetomium globosum CBS 148.51]|uniref:Uncharacterized protein n=1 Tax=Chaetomium globosum (strain ATCC 6205 / CBS 148.51 / DSM 1962 / NBRC 6347 / NRRL 1970) TaxID=306901 RepID=Q2GPM2_CHAGB|nr:uncharacterized protein CHGG_10082 [Chaetomium globosum CBS 148.51]EAQ83678.1 predicted protein [Chaetomium globosum CBS 148.51]